MADISAVIFILLAGMGFSSLVISHKFGALLAVIGAVSFFSIALMMFANYDVVSQTTYVDNTSQWNQTDWIIGGENDDEEEVQPKIWIGWLFFVLGLVAVVVFFVEALKLGKSP